MVIALLYSPDNHRSEPATPTLQPPIEFKSVPAPTPVLPPSVKSPASHSDRASAQADKSDGVASSATALKPKPTPATDDFQEFLKTYTPQNAGPACEASRIRPETGKHIWEPTGVSGQGALRIDNGTGYDAVAKLKDVETDEVRQFVYVRAYSSANLSDIGPCRCSLYFELGSAWNNEEESFCAVAGYEVFDDSFRFAETETRAVVFSVTLHPVPEGKARTTRLSKEEFEKQVGRSHRRR